MNQYALTYRVWQFQRVHEALCRGGSDFRMLTQPVCETSRQRGMVATTVRAHTAADAVVQANVALTEELRRICGEYPAPDLVEVNPL